MQAARAGASSSSPLSPLHPSPSHLTRLDAPRSALTLVGESDRKLVKLAMKHAPPESVKQRSLPTEAVAAAAKTLRALEPEVKAVYQEEREEKEVRVTCWGFPSRARPAPPRSAPPRQS